MLTNNRILQRKNGLFDLSDSDKLADILNHDIMKLKLMEIAKITHYYDCFFIEEVLNKVESLSDIDRFIGIIKTHWELDVYDHRDMVTKYDPSTREYVPYVPDLKTKLDSIRDKISHKRELKQKLDKQWEEWEVEHQSPATKTEVPQFLSTSPAIQFESCINTKDSDIDIDIEYKMDNLPEDVKNQILISNDQLYSEFVTTMQGPMKQWIDKHRLQDWNVVRFICRLRGIVTRKCSMNLFGKFLESIGLGNQESNMKQRKDANNDTYMKDYDDPNKKKYFWKLKSDGDAVEKILEPIITKMNEAA